MLGQQCGGGVQGTQGDQLRNQHGLATVGVIKLAGLQALQYGS